MLHYYIACDNLIVFKNMLVFGITYKSFVAHIAFAAAQFLKQFVCNLQDLVPTITSLNMNGTHIKQTESELATCTNYGTPEGTFLFQYLPEKKSKQKELERKSKQ